MNSLHRTVQPRSPTLSPAWESIPSRSGLVGGGEDSSFAGPKAASREVLQCLRVQPNRYPTRSARFYKSSILKEVGEYFHASLNSFLTQSVLTDFCCTFNASSSPKSERPLRGLSCKSLRNTVSASAALPCRSKAPPSASRTG